MQYCVWTIRDQRYATAAKWIVEVASLVQPRPLDHAPPWIRGLMNYRGDLVPLVDGAILLGQDAIAPRRTARIVVLDCPAESGKSPRLGLLVEHVVGVEALDFSEPAAHPGLELADANYLGPLLSTPAGTTQLVELEHLLTPAHRELLFGRREKIS